MYKINRKLELIEVEDGSALLSDEAGNIHSLNKTAKLIYDLCLKKMEINDICNYIRQNYKTDDTLEKKVKNCIDTFKNKKILE